MKKLVISSIFLCAISLASSALSLNLEGPQTAALVEDLLNPQIFYDISIPSSIDYSIEPTPPLSLDFLGEFDGLDWYNLYYTNPLADPIAGTLATVTLTFPATFAIADVEYVGDLTVWDTASSTALDMEPVFVAVPEPATVVLLGLGGLVLRKRK